MDACIILDTIRVDLGSQDSIWLGVGLIRRLRRRVELDLLSAIRTVLYDFKSGLSFLLFLAQTALVLVLRA